ncbi:helix-turn-helix domain-containing protein [Enterobacter cloacae complex sp. I7]|uniref:winged helix-turn-helix domain-containing protein n=2 Tax=Enterobacteriaceae TaxID=543 RepID=UPI000799009E|nr:helix-turn-helix domain-containing protein [Enterobacter bugandensis]MBE3540872.1 helix-turn-helix domain-containing protein [Enterobacter cloacae complex sp. I7]MCK7239382.1 helix-turn-helix domain-containing protein [Enterobacter bugandensis]MDE7592259.1 helix-turn-helix domain-containing protein [Enterobacter bugandensis]SAI09215.1 transcriptional regulator [Enterobacter bugandensis]HDX4395501.1 helix-turn-helix domain-containing protein [Enterobacter bugandensis]
MNNEEISLSASVTFVPEKSSLATVDHGDIHLTPNERRLLELILSGKCKKETIFEEIWLNQGMIVSESSYHQLIKMLRRKLQNAGLPGSIIKTIPRYGVVLAPCETQDSEVACPPPEEPDNASSPTPVDCPSLPAITAESMKTPSRQYGPLLAALCSLLIILPTLVVVCTADTPQAFQENLYVDGVMFHLSSLRSVDRQALARKRHALPAGINNVYIASNGPKVFVAQCEGELSQEGKCGYEYYSSY